MNKALRNILYCLLSSTWCFGQVDNSNWQFVGPYSNNNINGNTTGAHEFETGQVNYIAVNPDPNKSNHLFCAGKHAGLWESLDRGQNWNEISTIPLGLNGVNGIAFRNSNEILVGNFNTNISIPLSYSNKVGLYNFTNKTWKLLTDLPSNGARYTIRSVAVHPGNTNMFFVSTSIGLFRSTDSGMSWKKAANGFMENVAFVAASGNPVTYLVYVAGSSVTDPFIPHGNAILMESSNDGASFNDISSSLITTSTKVKYGHATVCAGESQFQINRRIYTLTVATDGTPLLWDKYGWDTYSGELIINRINKNVSTGAISNVNPQGSNSYCSSGNGYGSPDRMALTFDPQNYGLWFGGQTLSYLGLANNTATCRVRPDVHISNGNIHDDIHDIIISNNDKGIPELLVACDGGIAKSTLELPNSINFVPLNNNLNVAYINGFSGSAKEPNIYAIGKFDIVYSDVYDANAKRNRFTHSTWENDGAFIDKFDPDLMIFDGNSYGDSYLTSNDRGKTLQNAVFYDAKLNSPVFQEGSPTFWQGTAHFSEKLFYQDPYRPNRIFFVKGSIEGIQQFDKTTNHFIRKITPKFTQANTNNQPVPYDETGDFKIGYWNVTPIAISTSQQTINSMHILVNGKYEFDNTKNRYFASRPTVLKYIGKNIDDCWSGHNLATYLDQSGQTKPQWESLTASLWESLSTVNSCTSCTNLTTDDKITDVRFQQVETSPWDKNTIYVSFAYVPDNPSIKVFKYEGNSWTNYSQGIPQGENPTSMIMDHGSNDGIYLCTDKFVYYRDKSMSSWMQFSSGYPIMPSKQIEINYYENTVRAGTTGRGIFKSNLICPNTSRLNLTNNNQPIVKKFYEAKDVTADNLKIDMSAPVITAFRATNKIELNPGFVADATSGVEFSGFHAFIHKCDAIGNSSPDYMKTYSSLYDELSTINELPEEKSVSVFPNPSGGKFAIKINSNSKENAEIKIFNTLGALVFHKNEVPSNQEYLIDLSDYKTGLYYINIMIDGEQKSIRYIKQ